MKNKLLLFAFITCVCPCIGQLKNGAWIEEKFASNIMERKVICEKHLFPIVGFEFEDGNMYVLSYGGELQPILIEGEESRWGRIINFESTINTQEWPDKMVRRYRNADYLIKIGQDTIVVMINLSGKQEIYRYISNLNGSRFKSIVEIKGCLLDYLIPSVFPKGSRGQVFDSLTIKEEMSRFLRETNKSCQCRVPNP